MMKHDSTITQELKLIAGTFTAPEARDILLHFLSKKISFHEMQNLRHFEKCGRSDEHSQCRLQELKETRKNLLGILEEAENIGSSLSIESKLDLKITRHN